MYGYRCKENKSAHPRRTLRSEGSHTHEHASIHDAQPARPLDGQIRVHHPVRRIPRRHPRRARRVPDRRRLRARVRVDLRVRVRLAKNPERLHDVSVPGARCDDAPRSFDGLADREHVHVGRE